MLTKSDLDRLERVSILQDLENARVAIARAKSTGQDYGLWQSAQGFQRAIARAERALNDAFLAS